MGLTTRFRVFYLSHLSRPESDRPIYRTIQRRRARRIVEIGIGTGRRAIRMIEVAAVETPTSQIHYTGVDLFESCSAVDEPRVSLKTAHRLLKATGARIQLVPGDPFSALSRTANSLGTCDLVVISHQQDRQSMARAWFYVPRLLHPGSVVFAEDGDPNGGVGLRVVTATEIEKLAAAGLAQRAA